MNEKGQSVDTSTNVNWMVELLDGDLKTAAVKVLECTITDILETNEKIEDLIRETKRF